MSFGSKFRGSILPKVKHTMWRAYHDILRTKDNLAQKNIGIGSECMWCDGETETTFYVLFTCRKAKVAWKLRGRGLRWEWGLLVVAERSLELYIVQEGMPVLKKWP